MSGMWVPMARIQVDSCFHTWQDNNDGTESVCREHLDSNGLETPLERHVACTHSSTTTVSFNITIHRIEQAIVYHWQPPFARLSPVSDTRVSDEPPVKCEEMGAYGWR